SSSRTIWRSMPPRRISRSTTMRRRSSRRHFHNRISPSTPRMPFYLLRGRGGFALDEDFGQPRIARGQVGAVGLLLLEEGLQHRLIADRLVHLRIGTHAVGAEPDQLGHVVV